MSYLTRTILAVTVCLLLGSCASSGSGSLADEIRAWDGNVQVHGALRAMMHEGQTGAAVTLDGLTPDETLFAVGAMADLAGEITVAGGLVHLAWPEGVGRARYRLMRESSQGAALLVAANVPSWQSFPIDRRILFDDLDAEVARFAALAGLPAKGRIPFLIEGPFEKLQIHVIDGRRLPGGESTHQDHVAAAVRTMWPEARATLVGFFSATDQGVFTHMGSMTHVHAVVEGTLASGHVDHVVVPAGTTIRLPVLAPR